MFYTQSVVLILYLVRISYPVRSPWSAVRSPSFILTATFSPELIFEFKQSVLGLVEKRSMWRNVRTVGKSGGSCTFPGHKGETPGGYSHTLPIRVCAAQRGRDFEAPDLERGIHFRGVF